ncbi:type II secretion system protein GspM [Roseateles koreensis]|uniref:Type II secretion system protein GspM n=1 Tax=Roseateles koreensis TaxID=2987526 RepID=A0ABT5KRH6_9BURK|nr:type II secretion system protein GspM [Roseateles koreensis]MDC8785457.1 type II secretion system protein GspM [Roseateles koreensis]
MSERPLSPWQAAAHNVQNHWQQLGPRDRRLLKITGAALGVLLLWLVAVQPALHVLAQSPAQLEAVDLQLQEMQALAQETKALRATPPVPAAAATQALQAASDHLGSGAHLTLNGDRAVLTLNGVSSEALQAWLGEVRSAARARPVEAQLQRGPKGFAGTVVLSLGANAP